jgi:predicted ATPase/DNA-binding SARP family transcriptional activator
VTLEGEPVTRFESDKARALLAYLTVEADRAHRREKLAGMLWPESTEQVARAYLRRLLVNIRRVIGDYQAQPPPLHIIRQTIQFNVLSDAWVDVSTFLTLVKTRKSTDQEIIQQLEEAVDLYRGGFLESFSLAGCPAFEEWALLNREHFHRLVMDALRRLAKGYEGRGEFARALPHAWRQVELDPWREQAHLQVMRLLALNGQRGASLAQYDRCRRLLRDELGVEPSAETTELYEAIRHGKLTARTMTEQPGDRVAPEFQSLPLYNLPSQATPLVGRENELAALEALLADATVRLITITGPGGIGKTRLALALGALLAENQGAGEPGAASLLFPHGIVFVALAGASSAQDIVPTMAEALQLRLERGQVQLFDYLHRKQLLLVVDNLEHLLDGVGPLAEILRVAPRVKILVTSREPLGMNGEHLFPLQGLAFPEEDPTPFTLADVDVDTYVDTYSALKLFATSARRVQPAFSPDHEELISLARICRLVEGMPLALELAASWVRALSINDILAEIQRSLDFLRTEWSGVLRRQRSVRVVFDTSWGQLGKAEQMLFPQLSVFRGGFTKAAAAAVRRRGTTIAPLSLSRLVDKSFIRYDHTSDRYEVHELLRQYGAEKLAQDPADEADLRDEHSRYYCRWLQEQEASLSSTKQQAVLQEIEAELENVLAACQWAASQGRVNRLSEAIGALSRFYHWRRSYQAGEIVLGNLAERLSEAHESGSLITDIVQRTMARILVWQSRFSRLLGYAERSRRLARESLELLDSPVLAGQDTRLERAHVWVQRGYEHIGKDPEKARRLFIRGRDLFREIGDRDSLAYTLLGLGRVARNLHDYQAAKEAYGEALALSQAIGDQIGSAEALQLLSSIADLQGQAAEAERLARKGLAITRDAYGLLCLGYILICSGRFDEAETISAESLAWFAELEMPGMEFWAVLDMGQVRLHQGSYRLARTHLEEALALAHQVDSDRQKGIALGLLAALALAEGADACVREHCEESLAIWQGDPGHLSPHISFGLAARRLGNHDEARRHILDQLRWDMEHRSTFYLVTTLAGIALLLADAGKVEQAVEVYACASSHPFVANSRWFEDVVGAEVSAVAAQLPPKVAQVAYARGQAADRWQVAKELMLRNHL